MKLRMVDRIRSWTPYRAISGVKTISFEEYNLKAAFGGDSVLPATLLIECLLQLGNWLTILSSDFTQMGLLVQFDRAHFHHPAKPSDSIVLDVTVRGRHEDSIVFDGCARVGSTPIVTGERCMAILVPLAAYYSDEDLRTLYSEILRSR